MTDIEVAKSIRKAIDMFRKSKPKHLNQINVVVFEKKMVPAFKDALLKSTIDQPNSASHSKQALQTTPAPVSMQSQAGSVTVTSGDILVSNCEAMFNTVGSDFNLKGWRH